MKSEGYIVYEHVGRNPFVNQVVCFKMKSEGYIVYEHVGRNPFVNQVVCFKELTQEQKNEAQETSVAIPS